MTNVFIISEGDDVGGVSIAIQRAFEKVAPDGWNVRSMRGSNNYIDYPVDLSWDLDLFHQMWEWADVIHAMEKMDGILYYHNPIGKPMVLHHHGMIYRWNPDGLNAVTDAHNLVTLCSTIDMTALSPKVEWLPNPVDVGWMQDIRTQYRPAPERFRLRFVHSPTAFREAKGTHLWAPAVKKVGGEFLVTEGATWAQALAHKATGDVHLDQLMHGYGNSGLEAMGMGLPVVSGGVADVEKMIIDKVGYLPYHPAMDRVREAVTEILDPDLRKEVSERCFTYVQDYHSQEKVVSKLIGHYEDAMDRYDPSEPVWE